MQNTTRRHRESPRLPAFGYLGNHAYHLVTATRARRPHLLIPGAREMCIKALREACEKHAFRCDAYCFMPDHAHLLVVSETGGSVERFMRLFKQLTGWRFKQKIGDHLWQTSYYDRVLRVEEAVQSIADYIWHNPVRAGIADSSLDYPFSGPSESMRGYPAIGAWRGRSP